MGGRGPKVRSKGPHWVLSMTLMDEATHDVDVRAEATGEWHLPTGGLVFRRPAEAPPVLHCQHSSLIERQFRPRQWRLPQGSPPWWPGAGCPGWHVQHLAAASCPTPHFRMLMVVGTERCRNSMRSLRLFCQGGILCCECVWASAVHGGWIS